MGLISAVEDVGRKLRRGIGESLRSVLAAPPLAQVTTASLPALRAYSASRRAEAEGQRPRAVALAKEALAIDSTFAAAWGGLYVTYTNMGFVRLATEAAERAYKLRDHLSEVERLKIETYYHQTRDDFIAEEAAYQRLADREQGLIGYSDMLLAQRRLPEAEAMAKRAVATEPKNPIAYWNLAEAQVAQQRFEAADSTAALVTRELPANQYRYGIPGSILFGRRNFAGLDSFLTAAESAKFRWAPQYRCLVNLHRGRIRAWQQCPVRDGPFAQRVELIMAEFRMTGDTARARTGYAAFLATPPNERNPDRYPAVITLLADVGHVHEARQLLDEWRSRLGTTVLGFRADSAGVIGAIAAAEEQWDRAVAAFLAWNASVAGSAMHLYNRGWPEAAAILARNRQPDSAIALFEQALGTSSLFGGEVYEAGWYSQALSMLGDLYQARGDRAKAAEYYRRYVDLLEGADPPVAAQVAAVREKLRRLSGESGAAVKP